MDWLNGLNRPKSAFNLLNVQIDNPGALPLALLMSPCWGFPGALPQALLMSPRWGFPGALPQALLMSPRWGLLV